MTKRTKKILFCIRRFTKDFVIPIMVGVCSTIVACRANEIAELQAMITKNSERPTIEVTEYIPGENSYSEVNEAVINISILDGKYNNYKSEIRTFLVIKYDGYYENHLWVPFVKTDIPLTEYYSSQPAHHSLYGNIETLHTSQAFVALQNLINDAYYEIGDKLVFTISTESCLKITYTNLLNELETAYYLIDSDKPGIVDRIDEKYGEKRFEKWAEMYERDLYISPYNSVDDLFQMEDNVDAAGGIFKDTDDTSTT